MVVRHFLYPFGLVLKCYHSRNNCYMQSLFPQELILDYSYSRGVRRNYLPTTVTAAVAAWSYFPITVTAAVPARKDRK